MRFKTGATLRALIPVGATGAMLLGVFLSVLAFAGAGVASAHATRIATDPAEGAELTQSPQRVSATFSETLQPAFAAMTVVGPDGNLWSDGDPQVQGAVIGVGVRPLGPAGTYTVNYRVTSTDGHVVSGAWSFRLAMASTGMPGPSVTATNDPPEDGIPVWPFVVGTALITAGGAWWAVRRRT